MMRIAALLLFVGCGFTATADDPKAATPDAGASGGSGGTGTVAAPDGGTAIDAPVDAPPCRKGPGPKGADCGPNDHL